MARLKGPAGTVQALRQLSGGANMETWAFEYAGLPWVLRRAPGGVPLPEQAYPHDVEAALLQAAAAAGVRVPPVAGVLQPADGLGSGYVMHHVEGSAEPQAILAAPQPGLLEELAGELVRIHAIAPQAALPLPTLAPEEGLAGLRAQFEAFGADRPVLALALRWCQEHLPTPCAPRLVHGDFRMGNLLVGPQGLAVVLDWELSHWGDPHEDLAYACLTAWRFGRIEHEAFGLASLQAWLAAYQAAGGAPVDRARLRFWLVYRTLWWALGCLRMGQRWRSGAERNLERVVIARRTSENELDLLLLLEEDAPAEARARIALATLPEPAPVRGEPSPFEVLQALREWVLAEVKPRAEGRAKFMAAVAANALGQLQREALHPVNPHDAALSAELAAGRATLATPGVLSRLRATTLAKLANDGPKYAALALARQRWLHHVQPIEQEGPTP